MDASRRPSTYRQRILQVQLYIQAHLDEDLSLERLARVAHFSPYHFHRIFRGVVGEGVAEHIRRLRLERAALRLGSTDTSIVQLAFDAGYGTHEAFSRAFRHHFGMTPSQYRRSREANAPREPSPSTGLVDALHEEGNDLPMDTTSATTHDVQVRTLDPIRVVSLRHVGPYKESGPTWMRLMAWAGPHGLFGPQTRTLGICHDDPDVTPPEKIRFDVSITVDEAFQLNAETDADLFEQTIAGGPYAVLKHLGSYDGLEATYRWLYGTWLPGSGREPGNIPAFEVYVNSPMEVAPDALITEIYIPLEPK